jgi:hypothetical protein
MIRRGFTPIGFMSVSLQDMNTMKEFKCDREVGSLDHLIIIQEAEGKKRGWFNLLGPKDKEARTQTIYVCDDVK